MGVISRQVVYQVIGEAELKLHVFEPMDRKEGTALPAIVFFFGGGWVGGTPEQFYPQSRYLAARGMVAISAEYRVKERHGVTPFECVADGKSAIRWVRSRAAEMGIDPDKVAAGGGSAGGHVALCTAMIKGHDEGGVFHSTPDALVLFNPGVDTTAEPIVARMPEGRARELSPMHHIREGLPPSILFHGTEDQVVPFGHAERFCAKMRAAGNWCQLVAFEGKAHGFFNYGRDGNTSFEETVRAMDRFLASLGYLEGEPAL